MIAEGKINGRQPLYPRTLTDLAYHQAFGRKNFVLDLSMVLRGTHRMLASDRHAWLQTPHEFSTQILPTGHSWAIASTGTTEEVLQVTKAGLATALVTFCGSSTITWLEAGTDRYTPAGTAVQKTFKQFTTLSAGSTLSVTFLHHQNR